MKRSRDDAFVSSQLKRPAISPLVEPSGQAQMSTASSAQRLTTTDALSYLKTVKEIFQDKRDKYDDFLEVMKDFKAQRKDNKSITEVYQEVSVLFQEHADLLVEFTHFLPDTSGAASIQYAQPEASHDKRQGQHIKLSKKPAVSYAVRDQYINHHGSEQWNHVEKEKEKREDKENNEWERDDSLDHKRKSARRDDSVTDLFHRGMQDPESAFLEKVKERLPDPEINKKISDCVRPYKSKFVTAAQFRTLYPIPSASRRTKIGAKVLNDHWVSVYFRK
ncbi:Paired amphipathic helix protein Sin3-like 4 [Sesamum alatum]|uniref:Paired amphipathic helix protein Sin3-like 4 n=1 Tax=Sesamum alatum TaxID=300844 RepID=A0AAE1YGK8_9LAMI|nr:Paired amphipathic helix protein Sin3-like 4 [Sesamum alatum]